MADGVVAAVAAVQEAARRAVTTAIEAARRRIGEARQTMSLESLGGSSSVPWKKVWAIFAAFWCLINVDNLWIWISIVCVVPSQGAGVVVGGWWFRKDVCCAFVV